MASGFGVLMILLGGFVMAIGYGMVSDCLSRFSNSPCWDPRLYGAPALGFYIGAVIVILGTVIVAGSDIARLLGRMKGAGADSEH